MDENVFLIAFFLSLPQMIYIHEYLHCFVAHSVGLDCTIEIPCRSSYASGCVVVNSIPDTSKKFQEIVDKTAFIQFILILTFNYFSIQFLNNALNN